MKNRSVIIAFVAATAIIAFLINRVWRPSDERITDEEARELVHRKNVAVGQLGNQQLEPAIPVFVEIGRRLPRDPLAPRNLAVARVVALGEEFQHATPERLRQARAALNSMRDIEGESVEYHWLAARLAAASQDNAGAESHLGRIVEADPANASAWFELFQRLREMEDVQGALEALDRAVTLQPDNLFLWMEYFRQAEEQLPRLGRTSVYANLLDRLEAAKSTLAPFQHELEIAGGPNVGNLLEEAREWARNNDFAGAAERLGQVSRLILPMASGDLAKIRPHPLEFMLERFGDDFYREHNLSEVPAPPAIEVRFAVADELAIPNELIGNRNIVEPIALADFDLDGRLDLILVSGRQLKVLGRPAGAASWQLITSVDVPEGTGGLIVQDLDLDFDETRGSAPGSEKAAGQQGSLSPEEDCLSADVDVVAYGDYGVRCFRNQLQAESSTRTLDLIEQSFADLRDVRVATATDVDGDGDLDLILARTQGLGIWSNRGNGSFEDIASRSSFGQSTEPILAFVPVDLERDADIDIVTATNSEVGWLENLRHGRLRWRTTTDELKGITSLEVMDADNDGSWDVVVANERGMHIIRMSARGDGSRVQLKRVEPLSDFAAAEIRALDYDNDGFGDLVARGSGLTAIYRGLPEGRFEKSNIDLSAAAMARTCGVGDLDNDGDVDLCVLNESGPVVLRNDGGNQNQWLDVVLKARQVKGGQSSASGRVNAYGLGSLLELKAGVAYQSQMVRGQSTHFGLGRQEKADFVRVLWLNGVPQNLIQPEARRTVCEQQLLTGSCPYLYAWNGKSFEFVTDLLWAAPLGLQVADGELAPCREWEYLRISSDQLVPRDGEYVLQLTEELWEAAYFDQVKLIAVDHPAEVEIYSNEKVGSPEMAKFKVHTVQNARRPIAARNHRGRDVLNEIAQEDGIYSKAFDRKLCQGLAEEHFLELELGDIGDAKQITLFLTGWIYPSGTSVSVGASQNPDLPKAHPPALSVPDGMGGWKEVLPFMGYPGGKTKTIAVDISGLFVNDDCRVRIKTNLELYWDQIFFTVDEPPAEVRLTELKVVGCDLHFRGYSKIEHRPHHGPEGFVYDLVTTQPKWPPMLGRFTRHGNVTELVNETDDRLLIMGAGDEATLRFSAPAEKLPEGWKRDFLFYSVGWDKDANLCTVLGETVEPLPFRSMKSYPPVEPAPTSREYQAYLRTYQTREQSRAFWEQIRRFESPADN
jgi:tetratricopeptide (TPR) repeat protein